MAPAVAVPLIVVLVLVFVGALGYVLDRTG
jgi:hypothetical protein